MWLPLLLCGTLGLAPFRPEPHLLEKIRMMMRSEPMQAVDVFDLVLHAMPWLLLALVVLARLACRNVQSASS